MRISKYLVAVSALAIMGAAFSGVSGAAATPPTAVGGDHVTCDTFFGAGKFSTPLNLVGGSPTTLTLKGTLDGCVDTDNPAVTFAPSGITTVVAFPDNFATALAAPQTVTAFADIKWKFDKTSVKTDLKTTHLTWTAEPAAVQSVAVPSLTGSFSESSVDAGTMSIAPGQAFNGGDNGAVSTFTQLLAQTTPALLGQMVDQGGLKGITAGAGNITVG